MPASQIPKPSIRRSSARRASSFLFLLLLLILAGCAGWTWVTLSWAYAEGERAGVLQKFVRRGWLCKTQEGEIAFYYGGGQYMGPGLSPQLWDFSVRNAAVADDLNKAVGHRVQVHFTEHPGVPTSCFAETRYFVDKVTVTDDPVSAPPSERPATLPEASVSSSAPPPPTTAPGP